MKIFANLLFILLCVSTDLFAQIPSGKENIPISDAEFEKEMMMLINNFRKKNRLNPLEWNESLARAARYHAKDMADDDYFEHDSYDRINGRLKKTLKTFDRVRKFLDKGLYVNSENIGTGQESAKEMFKDWVNSPGHRKNMLIPESKYIGIGYYFVEDDEYQHYWVMDTAN
jgi:uncharacterized protein YkwD